MKKPVDAEVKTESLQIVDILGVNKSLVEFVCNDGRVCVNPLTFDFTYVGLFGDTVLKSILRAKVMDDTASKIALLAACKLIYSMNCGGFNVLAENFPN
jgi:hypothetical protein